MGGRFLRNLAGERALPDDGLLGSAIKPGSARLFEWLKMCSKLTLHMARLR